MAEKLEFLITVKGNELDSNLKDAEKQARKTRDAVFSIEASFKGITDELSRVKASFVGNLGADVVKGAFNALRATLSDVVDNTRDYSKAISEVNSTLPQNVKLTNEQSDALKRLAVNYGSTATQQARGYYEVVSGGIEDTALAFNILRKANDVALGGLVDVNTATRVLTSTFTAFKDSGVTVAQVTDTLASVSQQSAVRFEELASTLGRVAPFASSSGISIGELAGSIAFLNKNSLQTEQAVTGLRGIIGAVVKPSQQAIEAAQQLGIEFNATALKSKGLVGFLQDVVTKSKGSSTNLGALFGDLNAINAVLAISKGGFQDYASTVDKATNSQGAAKRSADALRDSLDFKLKEKEAAYNALSVSIGEVLTPALTAAARIATAFLSVLTKSAPKDSIEGLNSELDKTNKIIEILSKTGLDKRLGLANLGIDASVLSNAKLNELLQKQIAIRDQLSSKIAEAEKKVSGGATGGATGGGKTPEEVAAEEAAASIVNIRLAAIDKLKVAEADYQVFKDQLAIDQKAQQNTLAQEDFDKLLADEQRKIDAKFANEEAITQKILDEETKRAALKEINTKKALEKDAVRAKIEKDSATQLATQKIEQLNRVSTTTENAFALATALAQDGSKTQFIIGKAAAAANILLSDAKARAMIPAQTALIPYPENLVAAASLNSYVTTQTALGLATVAATTIKGFANGGVVGASMGPDNTLATVRTGEMILNANQQETLFKAINGGGLGGDIVIQVDGREIARAVRTQVQQGYKIA